MASIVQSSTRGKRNVFISYSAEDREIADRIAAILDERGVPYFLDVKDIHWGESITAEVRKGLHQSTHIIVVLSPASLNSAWVPYEIGHAIGTQKQVLPFVTYKSLDLPGYISGLRHISSLDEVGEYFEYDLRQTEYDTQNYIAYTWIDDVVALAEFVSLRFRRHEYNTDIFGMIYGLSTLKYASNDDSCSVVNENRGQYQFNGTRHWQHQSLLFQAEQGESGVISLKVDPTEYMLWGFSTILRDGNLVSCPCHWLKLPRRRQPETENEVLSLSQRLFTIRGRLDYYDDHREIMAPLMGWKLPPVTTFFARIANPRLDYDAESLTWDSISEYSGRQFW